MAKAKDISGKPDGKVSGLAAPARDATSTYKVASKWTVGSWLTNDQNARRFQHIDAQWYLHTSYGRLHKSVPGQGTGFKESWIWLTDFTASSKVRYTRASFYPVTSCKLTGVTVEVRGTNAKGWGPWASSYMSFSTPRSPSLDAVSRASETGSLSTTVKTNAGKDRQERYDTQWKIEVYDSRKAKWQTVKSGSTTSTEFGLSWDVADQQALGYSAYVKVKFSARARGFAGDSTWASREHVLAWPAQPSITKVSCSSRDANGLCTVGVRTNSSANHPVDRVKLQVLKDCDYTSASQMSASDDWEDTGSIDSANCTALACPTSALLPQAGKRTWIRLKNYHDDESVFCRYSSPYRMTQLERPVPPVPSAADDVADIVSATSGADGASMRVLVGWHADDSDGTELSWSEHQDAWTSTEAPSRYSFEWSDAAPQAEGYARTALVTVRGLEAGVEYFFRARRYMDAEGGEKFGPYSAWTAHTLAPPPPGNVVLSAPSWIEEGQPAAFSWSLDGDWPQIAWQLRCTSGLYGEMRRWRVGIREPADSYSVVPGTITDVATGEQVEPDVPDPTFVAFAVDLPDGDYEVIGDWYGLGVGEETFWCFVYDPATRSVRRPAAGDGYPSDVLAEMQAMWDGNRRALASRMEETPYLICHSDEDGLFRYSMVVAQGEDAFGTCTVDAERMLEAAASHGGAPVATFVASVSTGGEWVDSNEVAVGVAGRPSCWIEPFPLDVTVQPLGFSVFTGQGGTVSATVCSLGAWGQGADGRESEQLPGDVVWTYAQNPGWVWDPEAGASRADMQAPEGLDLRNGCTYYLEASVTDEQTGLASEPVGMTFEVRWDHLAPAPSEAIEVAASVESDGSGGVVRQAEIALVEPDGSEEGDVYDVYRIGADGPELVAAGMPLDARVIDRYAPFGKGERRYRVACRTADGDVDWADYPYELEGAALRIDWPGGSVELPYNLEVQDSYEKDFEPRTHLDGTVQGYWNRGVAMSSGMSTDVMALRDRDTIARLRELANHDGPVFVRTPDGAAYQANVNVSGLDSDGGPSTAVALDAVRVATTEAFMATDSESIAQGAV